MSFLLRRAMPPERRLRENAIMDAGGLRTKAVAPASRDAMHAAKVGGSAAAEELSQSVAAAAARLRRPIAHKAPRYKAARAPSQIHHRHTHTLGTLREQVEQWKMDRGEGKDAKNALDVVGDDGGGVRVVRADLVVLKSPLDGPVPAPPPRQTAKNDR